MSDYAKESGHWYQKDGTPAYTQTVKSGKRKGQDRGTNIGDAKKLGLLPSVTMINNILAKPGLENWKIDQAILSALTSPDRAAYESGEIPEKVARYSKTPVMIVRRYEGAVKSFINKVLG